MATDEMRHAYDLWKALVSEMAGETTIDGMRKTFDEFFFQFPEPEGLECQSGQVGEVGCLWVSVPGASADRVTIWLHGGGYIMGSAAASRGLGGWIARASDGRVLLVDYRLAPEHPFPSAVDDACA